MKILITGAAGFIGFNLAEHLLKKNYDVYGIDNFDDYYSIPLKKKRLSILKKYKRFRFKNLDIVNKKKVELYFNSIDLNVIVNLAAQAGVRYSLENPKKYLDVNILGFLNLLKVAKKNKIKKFLYASSSSVYGESTSFPLREKEKLNPKNVYAISKKLNEEIAEMHHQIDGIKFIGLRFLQFLVSGKARYVYVKVI